MTTAVVIMSTRCTLDVDLVALRMSGQEALALQLTYQALSC